MQANAKEILNAAKVTQNFETIRDRAVIREDDLPAFNIIGRRKPVESQDTAYKSYNGPWLYDCMITIAEDKEQADDEDFSGTDFELLESLTNAVLDALLGDGDWELQNDIEYGKTSVISGRETLGAAFTLGKHQVDRYG